MVANALAFVHSSLRSPGAPSLGPWGGTMEHRDSAREVSAQVIADATRVDVMGRIRDYISWLENDAEVSAQYKPSLETVIMRVMTPDQISTDPQTDKLVLVMPLGTSRTIASCLAHIYLEPHLISWTFGALSTPPGGVCKIVVVTNDRCTLTQGIMNPHESLTTAALAELARWMVTSSVPKSEATDGGVNCCLR